MTSLLRSLILVSLLAALAPAGSAQPPADLQLNSLGISVSSPLAARHAGDGTNRLFIVERGGTIQIYELSTGLPGPPFLNIVADVDTDNSGGLLGLAFHPNYATNGYFYVNYTRCTEPRPDCFPMETVIDRFEVSASDPDDADETSRVEILTISQPNGQHKGGDIHFGPDGYLYIGMGDGGPSANGQDTASLLGKMLRIDPCDTPACPQPYDVPPDNPFVVGPELDEIWGIGFRNPFRWSFDRETGDLLVADVGGSREEVSFEAAGGSGGLNYGWDCRQGDMPGPGGCSGTFVEPILVYPHMGGGCSGAIIGGFRYRGCIKGLVGTYVFADFCTGQVFFGTEDSPGNWSFSEWDDLSGNVFGFGEDEDGELYLLEAGSVSRFESPSVCAIGEIFSDGFESGDTSAWD